MQAVVLVQEFNHEVKLASMQFQANERDRAEANYIDAIFTANQALARCHTGTLESEAWEVKRAAVVVLLNLVRRGMQWTSVYIDLYAMAINVKDVQ